MTLAEPDAEALPLAGRHVVVTRPRSQAHGLVALLEAAGARVTTLPAISIEPVDDTAVLDSAIAELPSYDWLIFTSANGVRVFHDRLHALGKSWSARGRARVAAIGPATGQVLAEVGVEPELMPAEYVAEALVDALGNVAGQRVLLPRADIARAALAEALSLRGAEVTEVAAYRTVSAPIGVDVLDRALSGPERADTITFTSSSTVRGLLAGIQAHGLEPREALEGVVLAAIGPITASTLREHDLEPSVVAETYTAQGLVQALVGYYAGNAATNTAAM